MHFVTALHALLGNAPDFSGGNDPIPGSEKIMKLGHWVLWLASAACVIGVIVTGARMAIAHSHGEMQQHGKTLGIVMAGCIVVGAATGIAGALL